MKLLNFSTPEGGTHFGAIVGDRAVPFDSLTQAQQFTSTEAWIQALPQSLADAQTLLEKLDPANIDAPKLDEVKILPPVPKPPALFDFGLTPRHLLNSAETMFKHEFGGIKRRIATALVKRRLNKMGDSDVIPYYKGNHHAIIGDGDVTGWPTYSSYIDFEPELAVVYGTPQCPIAGYTIFNDMSARDIQWPEMIGTGPTRSKDFDRSNGLGPFLVTPDEIPDPRKLGVTVQVADRLTWTGSTAEYTHAPMAVIEYLSSFLKLHPGTIIGMGTIPDCTGLDNDKWVLPGERVAITFDGLGTLIQHIPQPPVAMLPSRWKDRIF